MRAQNESKEVLHGIPAKEVEIEHLKTITIALDEKVQVLDSVREELAVEHEKTKTVETARIDLQGQLALTAT